MNRRHSVYLGLIALLVAVNLVRWWPHPGNGAGKSAMRGNVYLPEDFRLRMDSSAAAGKLQRNLFQQKSGATRMAPTQNRQNMVAAKPAAQPGQRIAEAAGGELGKLKLLGVVFRAGKGQAYLAMEKENVIAFAGDTMFGQFVVDKVDVDGVELRDLKNNTSRRIPVSGK